jgi:hypothetical protein
LLQKVYLSFEDGRHGAFHLWDSKDSLDRFQQSDLARTIPDAYQVEGTPDVELAEVVTLLYPERQHAAS